ncbi:MAG: T9SS type A sorting domain-containing protein, partial [Bacteroidota bacterium]
GTNWKDIENIPTTQVYQVAYNPHEPQDYYAGAQDNGTSFGNSSTINDWNKIYGGDGFRTVFHPLNPKVFYAQIQRGVILVTVNGGQSWEVATEGIPDSDRKNWDTPYLMSMHDPNVLFTGTHRVYKTETGPMPVWKAISPDLTNGETRNLSQTISTIHQSSLNPAILYAATTDGNIWRTLDEGANWTKLEGLPKRYFTEVVASPESEQTVFATISGYKDNENTAHIYRSDNQGDTWYSIAGNLPPLAINCLQVIPNQDDQIIFVGTDGGVYGTLNGGASWERVGTNLPIVAAYDLEWNPSENRLVVGTFARSVLSYPLDGIVREDNLSSVNYKEADVQPLTIFPNPALQEISLTFTNERPNKAVILSILDVEGRIVQTTKKPTNRLVNWQVDVSHLMAGQYWVQVQGEVFRYSASFIKL